MPHPNEDFIDHNKSAKNQTSDHETSVAQSMSGGVRNEMGERLCIKYPWVRRVSLWQESLIQSPSHKRLLNLLVEVNILEAVVRDVQGGSNP